MNTTISEKNTYSHKCKSISIYIYVCTATPTSMNVVKHPLLAPSGWAARSIYHCCPLICALGNMTKQIPKTCTMSGGLSN